MNPGPTTRNLILTGLVGALVIAILVMTNRHASVLALVLGTAVFVALWAGLMTRWAQHWPNR